MKLNTKVVPCVILSLFIHPSTQHHIIDRICWAFSVYLESVSVLPQLHVMQNTKVLETRGRLLIALGHGLWPSMVLVSEIVQPFILANFYYYYIKGKYKHLDDHGDTLGSSKVTFTNERSFFLRLQSRWWTACATASCRSCVTEMFFGQISLLPLLP